MAYVKLYTRINWKNKIESLSTPLGAINMNKMDYAINEMDNRTVELDIKKAEQSTVLNMISNWTMDESTGIITVTKLNGEQIMFDLNVEKIPVSFAMSAAGVITMITDDGTEYTADISALIPVLSFNSSDTINITVSGNGTNRTYSFDVKDGSVTPEKLQPNYLADITVLSESARENAMSASSDARVASERAITTQSYAVGGTGTRENEDTDNAKYYYQQTMQMSQTINGIVPMGTVAFAELPTTDIAKNAMYNVSDAFTSDERFNDGGGVYYGPGNNVIWTAEGKWDITAPSAVTGIKGANEDTYRQGNVNLTPENIGALAGQNVYNDGADAHNITTPGVYTVGSHCANVPFSTGWGIMIVSNLDNNPAYTNQILYCVDEKKLYSKQCENGVWPDAWNDDFHGTIITTSDDKVGMFSDNEGGNIYWVAPDGSRWEIDSIDGTKCRLFRYNPDGSEFKFFQFNGVTGEISVNDVPLNTNAGADFVADTADEWIEVVKAHCENNLPNGVTTFYAGWSGRNFGIATFKCTVVDNVTLSELTVYNPSYANYPVTFFYSTLTGWTKQETKLSVHDRNAYDADTLYDTGIYKFVNGTNAPTLYGTLFVMSYRNTTGNTKPDFATQIFLPNGDDDTYPNSMFWRTSLADKWNPWQEVGGKTKSGVDCIHFSSASGSRYVYLDLDMLRQYKMLQFITCTDYGNDGDIYVPMGDELDHNIMMPMQAFTHHSTCPIYRAMTNTGSIEMHTDSCLPDPDTDDSVKENALQVYLNCTNANKYLALIVYGIN